MALYPKTLPIEKLPLYVPPLRELAGALRKGLKNNFSEVNVEVVDCPDLTQKPFTLASKGLGGNTKILEIGGVTYLFPTVDEKRVYDLRDIVKLVHFDPAFIIGPRAGPYQSVGVGCEGIFNLNITNGSVEQHSRIAKIDDKDENPIQEILPDNESRLALVANLFISEGKPGKRAVRDHPLLEARSDEMVPFSFSEPYEVVIPKRDDWDLPRDLLGPRAALEQEYMGLDLTVQHFHSFSHHGEAGHYHNDVTADIVEYLGYFNIGEEIYRIDRPGQTRTWSWD